MKLFSVFTKYFKSYEVLPDHPLKYVKFFKLAELPNVRPDGYIVRMPFYVQGPENAHILFTPKENPGDMDMAYELSRFLLLCLDLNLQFVNQ